MAPDRPGAAARPFPLGPRGIVLLSILAAGLAAYLALGLSPSGLVPSGGGWDAFVDFFSSAFTPSLDYESPSVPEDAPPLLLQTLEAARRTLVFAAAAMSLSLLIGIVLGFPASSAWWEGDPAGGRSGPVRFFRRLAAPSILVAARSLIAFMRSIHELLWAVLFLAALGLNTFAAVVALAIPYGGTLAKIFSEMIDEAPRDSALALRAAGATPLQVFSFGLLPRALPDMAAYAFYRFECSVRSAAILGFFGYPTLGFHIKSAFQSGYYAQTWTYLWTLFLLVVLLDAWSGLVRRRFVGI